MYFIGFRFFYDVKEALERLLLSKHGAHSNLETTVEVSEQNSFFKMPPAVTHIHAVHLIFINKPHAAKSCVTSPKPIRSFSGY